MKKKLLIDVDTGVDDAQSIMLALASPDVEVLGITCCHGNTKLENVLKNTLRVLKIPVFRGCAKPLLAKKINAVDYHGADGLGEVPDPDAPGLELLQKKKAVKAMIKIAKENSGEVTLVATAPLTNLAVAVELEPSFPKHLKALYIMGGNTESRGNTTVCGEFNFVADPEAAHIVLDRFTCPIYIACWEFCCLRSLPWSFVDEWFSIDTKKAKFLKEISALSMKKARSPEYEKEITAGKGFNPCDLFAMAAAVDDTFITESEEVAVTVELTGAHTRGMMVLDYMEHLGKTDKAVIIKNVDSEKLKNMLMDALK
ncbi:Inosine-uridine preferring nucleoside hydrolase [Oryzias melastigma]|uniref:Inosine-uridine preferring nucleoside hydrolase n=1 Tax=Oryzias melastigma TaxID=30732 RepID=A0A834CB26_ORYME|nr:Inosine-uridine preferring nucleoside hydrolase [Oryzias melastigma]